MNDLDAVRGLRADVPAPTPERLARGRARLLAAMPGDDAPARRQERGWRFGFPFHVPLPRFNPPRPQSPLRKRALLTAAAGCVAFGLVASLLTYLIGRSGSSLTSPYALVAFFDNAAAAARSQSVALPSPDQAFYTRWELQSSSSFHHQCTVFWNLAPLTGEGPEYPSSGGCGGGVPSPVAGIRYATMPGRLYPDLRTLPTEPAALLTSLRAAAARGPNSWQLGLYSTATRDQIVFQLMVRLLEAPLSSDLRAAVYEVLAHYPGVTLVADAVDAAGRHGIGIKQPPGNADGMTMSGETVEFIVAPLTYRFLGVQVASSGYAWHSVSEAVIDSGLVTRPTQVTNG